MRKVCHFDIKPENIRICLSDNISNSEFGSRFRLIDFGFADEYPYYKYRHYGYGTHGYSVNLQDNKPEDWIPISNPNDWVIDYNNKKKYHYVDKDIITSDTMKHFKPILTPEEIEKIEKSDVYSLGRTFYQLNYFLKDIMQKRETCKIKNNLVIDIIDNMVKSCIRERYTTKKMFIRIDML